MAEYLEIQTDDEEVFAYVWVSSDSSGLIAQAYIQGVGKEDLIIGMVGRELQHLATVRGCTVIHEMTPSNHRAIALAVRTPGYEPTGEIHEGFPIFRKAFTP